MMIRYQEEDPTVNRGLLTTTRPLRILLGAWHHRIQWATTPLLRAPDARDPPSCSLLRCSQTFPSFHYVYMYVAMYVYTHSAHWACGCKFYLINLDENFFVSLEVRKSQEKLKKERKLEKEKKTKFQIISYFLLLDYLETVGLVTFVVAANFLSITHLLIKQ